MNFKNNYEILLMNNVQHDLYFRKRGHNTCHSNHDIHKKSYLSDTTDNIIVHQNENYTNHRSSNSVNKSLLKRRIIYGILAICITLSKTSLAATDTEIEENTSDTTNSTGNYAIYDP